MNLESYRNVLHERCPDAKLYFSKFLREMNLMEIIDSREEAEHLRPLLGGAEGGSGLALRQTATGGRELLGGETELLEIRWK
jgi:hypothetical protein